MHQPFGRSDPAQSAKEDPIGLVFHHDATTPGCSLPMPARSCRITKATAMASLVCTLRQRTVMQPLGTCVQVLGIPHRGCGGTKHQLDIGQEHQFRHRVARHDTRHGTPASGCHSRGRLQGGSDWSNKVSQAQRARSESKGRDGPCFSPCSGRASYLSSGWVGG